MVEKRRYTEHSLYLVFISNYKIPNSFIRIFKVFKRNRDTGQVVPSKNITSFVFES